MHQTKLRPSTFCQIVWIALQLSEQHTVEFNRSCRTHIWIILGTCYVYSLKTKQIETKTMATYFGFWSRHVCVFVVDDSKYIEREPISEFVDYTD